MKALRAKARSLGPGIAVAAVVAAAATFLSEHYTAPVMLFALLLGIALNFLNEQEHTRPGIELAAKALLRVGVALLGLRIGFGQIMALGWQPVVMVIGLIAITITASVLFARVIGLNPLFGFLSGGATAICGASAAMALSAALPPHDKKEQATLFTVIGVSIFSTLAMITYPLIARATGLTHLQAGMFIGATIHDVAQVVGAGYAISPETGDTATIVKLLRVAMLLPVILVAGQISRTQASGDVVRPPLLPLFVVAFVGLVLFNSLLTLPAFVIDMGNSVSKWCLVASIAAIGMKTRLGDIVSVGWRPVLLMLLETILLAAMTLALLFWRAI